MTTVERAAVELGETLPARTREAIRNFIEKYFGELIASAVYFSRDVSSYRSTVNVQVNGLDLVTAEATHRDCY